MNRRWRPLLTVRRRRFDPPFAQPAAQATPPPPQFGARRRQPMPALHRGVIWSLPARSSWVSSWAPRRGQVSARRRAGEFFQVPPAAQIVATPTNPAYVRRTRLATQPVRRGEFFWAAPAGVVAAGPGPVVARPTRTRRSSTTGRRGEFFGLVSTAGAAPPPAEVPARACRSRRPATVNTRRGRVFTAPPGTPAAVSATRAPEFQKRRRPTQARLRSGSFLDTVRTVVAPPAPGFVCQDFTTTVTAVRYSAAVTVVRYSAAGAAVTTSAAVTVVALEADVTICGR